MVDIQPNVVTLPYPDPDTSVGVEYYCFWDIDDLFDGGFMVDPAFGFPCDYGLNIGIANHMATRYVVVGMIALGGYVDTIGMSEENISKAGIDVFDPATGTRIWQKDLPVLDGEFVLVSDISAVGDFLGDDGIDEVRVVHARDLGDGRVSFRYTYYAIADGSFIKREFFVVPGA